MTDKADVLAKFAAALSALQEVVLNELLQANTEATMEILSHLESGEGRLRVVCDNFDIAVELVDKNEKSMNLVKITHGRMEVSH